MTEGKIFGNEFGLIFLFDTDKTIEVFKKKKCRQQIIAFFEF